MAQTWKSLIRTVVLNSYHYDLTKENIYSSQDLLQMIDDDDDDDDDANEKVNAMG